MFDELQPSHCTAHQCQPMAGVTAMSTWHSPPFRLAQAQRVAPVHGGRRPGPPPWKGAIHLCKQRVCRMACGSAPNTDRDAQGLHSPQPSVVSVPIEGCPW